MAETQRSSKDLRVRNVSLHSRGKTQIGTLYLQRHHLIFSYTPGASPESSSRPSESGLRAASGNLDAKKDVSSDGASSHARESTDSPARHGTPSAKARPKEIWVPYPMINHCILRPSHSQGLRAYDHIAHVEDGETGESEDPAFPPVFGTSSFDRPSTDSARLAPYSSPQRSVSPNAGVTSAGPASDGGRTPTLRIRRRDFQMMAFHFHNASSEKSVDEIAREVFYCLRGRCVVDRVQDMHAFHFKVPQEEMSAGPRSYDARREFQRMGIGGKAAEGPGSAWRISEINQNYEYSKTYPSTLCVPRSVSDNLLKYGGVFRSKCRIPALTYLHSNGGSITRSSQPMVGIQGKRNPQDERLVSAIFSSHTPLQQSPPDTPNQRPANPSEDSSSSAVDRDVPGLSLSRSETALDEKFSERDSTPRERVYGSTRRNLIVDARPRVNAQANRATGGGIEDISNYPGPSGTTVEKVFLNIANIHKMRQSLDLVIKSFANADYLEMKPNQEVLRKSGWLAHISNLLDGSEMVARVVGLGGSHVLVHCSDGWDRTAQVAALAALMLDPYYRSLEGFITLIQKDFMSFGHKFNHRHGIQGSDKWFEIENERVLPSRPKDSGASENTGFNKAISGAKNWFDKNRSNLFGQQNGTRTDSLGSRPTTPPPNALLHSPATTNVDEDQKSKTNVEEIAPIFHQFLDAVFQIHYQTPNAFEFNERFLRRLFYQAYSGQYGEFLFNCERERVENEGKFASAWPHFLSRRHEFINPEYIPKVDDPLLFPRRQSPNGDIEIRWWSALFGRKDEEMNTPRALAPPDPEMHQNQLSLSTQPSMVSLPESSHVRSDSVETETGGRSSSVVRETRSVPSFEAMRNSLSSTFASFQLGSPEPQAQQPTKDTQPSLRPVLEQRETDAAVLEKYITSTSADGDVDATPSQTDNHRADADEGDPLGVSGGSKVPETVAGRLDVAAFARQSAYSDR